VARAPAAQKWPKGWKNTGVLQRSVGVGPVLPNMPRFARASPSGDRPPVKRKSLFLLECLIKFTMMACLFRLVHLRELPPTFVISAVHRLEYSSYVCYLPSPFVLCAVWPGYACVRATFARALFCWDQQLDRDIKSLNILLSKDLSVAKIADLGVSRQVSNATAFLTTCYGTPLYASPEICKSSPYDEKTDLWSLGVVLYEMAALVPPFVAPSLVGLGDAIKAGR